MASELAMSDNGTIRSRGGTSSGSGGLGIEREHASAKEADTPMAVQPGIEEEAAEEDDTDWTVDNVLGHLVVETINVTAVHTNGQKLKERRTHVTAFRSMP